MKIGISASFAFHVGLGIALGALAGCSPQAADRGTAAPGSQGKPSVPSNQGKTPMTQSQNSVAPVVKLIADVTGPYGTHLAFDGEGKRWALADSRTIQLGNDGALDRKLTAPDVIHDVAWLADGKQLLACPMIYDLGQDAWEKLPGLGKAMAGGLASPPPPEQLGVAAGACSLDGKELIIATRFQPTRELGGEDSYGGPQERLLVVTSADRTLRGALYAGDLEQRAIAIGDRLIAAGGAKVQLWDRQSLRKVGELPHKLVARALAFNAAGDRLAVLTADGAVSLWDPAAGKLLTSFAAHQGDGYAIAFHPAQPWLATGGQDGKLRMWSLTGASLYEETLGGWVQAVAFAPGGAKLGAVTRTSPPHLMIYALSTP